MKPAPIVDFHSHVIPGVDDGARDAAQGLAALASFREQGVGVVVATPHLDAALTERPALLEGRLSEFDRGFARLEAALRASDVAIDLRRGTELKLDAPEPDVSDPRVRLAGTRFVLVEFVGFRLPPYGSRQLSILRDDGWIPIVAHPERYAGSGGRIEHLAEWRDAGAFLQVNSGSVTGQYGPEIQKVSVDIIGRGWADYLSSDYHTRGVLQVAAARRFLLELGGGDPAAALPSDRSPPGEGPTDRGADEASDEEASRRAGRTGPASAEWIIHLLTVVNPDLMLRGLAPRAVPPLAIQRKRWRALRQLFG